MPVTKRKSKPVHGDPAIDERGEKLLDELGEWFANEQMRQNLSFTLAKQLTEMLSLTKAAMLDTALTLMQKKIGGHKGGSKG